MKHFSFDDFDQLVRENQRMVYQIAFSVLGNAADTEDVTQDAFVRAYAKIASLRDPESFRAWVCQIVRRLALNRVRANTRTRRREELRPESAGIIDVETVVEDRDFQDRVQREIDRLPRKLRDVLLLCAVEGFEPIAVAELLRIPPGTVRSRLHLARKQLLKALAT